MFASASLEVSSPFFEQLLATPRELLDDRSCIDVLILSRYEFWRHPMVGNLRINGDRLWSSIMETARFGATPNGGINALTLTKEDAAVRHWFKEQSETLACKAIVAEVRHRFAIPPGRRAGMAPDARSAQLC